MLAVVTRTVLRLTLAEGRAAAGPLRIRWPAICCCCGRETPSGMRPVGAAAPEDAAGDVVAEVLRCLPTCGDCRRHAPGRRGWLAAVRGVGSFVFGPRCSPPAASSCLAPTVRVADGVAGTATRSVEISLFQDEFARALHAANSESVTLVERSAVMVDR